MTTATMEVTRTRETYSKARTLELRGLCSREVTDRPNKQITFHGETNGTSWEITIVDVKFAIVARVTESEFAQHDNDCDGLCLACGEWTTGGCEPDARGYRCEACDARKVYGASEALLMGRVLFIDESEG